MLKVLKPDICIIGAGAAGLSVAAGAAQMGTSVVLIEKSLMGGDCLNYGCIPSKALLAAGHAAHEVKTADKFGVKVSASNIDFELVHQHVKSVITAIEPNDSIERFMGLGVEVIIGQASFVSPKVLKVNNIEVRASRYVLAIGSEAFVPEIEGLDSINYYTNKTVFDLDELPSVLTILGGGPIGVELAQAYNNLGSKVNIVELETILSREDPDLVKEVRRSLVDSGVVVYENTRSVNFAQVKDKVSLSFIHNKQTKTLKASHILIACGRKVPSDVLKLSNAGIEHDGKSITVDKSLRTSNSRVYALGDCVGHQQLTHVASYQASIVIRNILFWQSTKVSYDHIPRVVYTNPELAHVGLSEKDARAKYKDNVRILVWHFNETDRAIAELQTEGCIKVIIGTRGTILGCGIVGPLAGELIQLWVLAISQKLKIGAIAGMVSPYPTFGEASKRVAGQYYKPFLFSTGMKKLVRFLAKFR